MFRLARQSSESEAMHDWKGPRLNLPQDLRLYKGRVAGLGLALGSLGLTLLKLHRFAAFLGAPSLASHIM